MATKLLKTINETTLTDLVHDIVEYVNGDTKNDAMIDEVNAMVIKALGINGNHNGTAKFRCNIMDLYDRLPADPNKTLIYCNKGIETYDFEDWKDDFDPNDPRFDSEMSEMYDRDIADIEEIDWDNFSFVIKNILEHHPIVMSGIGADWMGRSAGGYIFTDMDKFEKLVYPGYDATIKFWYDKNEKDFYMTESSHDCPMGGTVYHFRIMTDNGSSKWYMNYDDDYRHDREIIETFFNDDELTRKFELEELF